VGRLERIEQMKALKTATRAVLFSAFVLTCVRVACAQPLSPNDLSAELMVVRSQRVVRAVLETLKGKHCERLRFVVDGDFGSIRLADLQENKQEALLFLEPWFRSTRFNRATGGHAYPRFSFRVEAPAKEPILDFEVFKKRYGRQKPSAEKLTSCDRSGGGYVGVDSLELMAIDCDTMVRER